ncbi:MAG: PaaI family thioesterase [Pseudomonadota bacterium]|nr:PaaI family thioesterase [Pseudomonadota bacterium]
MHPPPPTRPAMDTATQEVLDLFGRVGLPPIALHLGWRLVSWNAESKIIRAEFLTQPEFLNPAGYVQGGILCAMLDDVMGSAFVAATGGALIQSSIDMHVSFLAAAKPGYLYGVGQVVQLGKTIAFLAATLEDAAGKTMARASVSAKVIPGPVPGVTRP